MKRKNLEDMGLTKSRERVVEMVSWLKNGADIEAIKKSGTYKTQLDTAQTTLKSFEGVNVTELRKITTLTNDLTKAASTRSSWQTVTLMTC